MRPRRLVTSALVGLAAMLGVLLTTVAYVAGLPPEYTGRALVLFGSRPTENGGLAGSDTVQAAAAGYVAFVSAPATIQEVANSIGEDPAVLKDGLAVTQLPTTSTVAVEFTAGQAEQAARGANALANTMARRAGTDPVVFAEVLTPAAVPNAPSGPARAVLVAAGGLLGLLVGGAVAGGLLLLGRDRSRWQAAPRTDAPDIDGVGPTATGAAT